MVERKVINNILTENDWFKTFLHILKSMRIQILSVDLLYSFLCVDLSVKEIFCTFHLQNM